jgi:lactoylglutathione lyase
MVTGITLVVLRCRDLVASRGFYAALGLELVREQHGSGPEHWSCRIGSTVVELYPGEGSGPTVGRIGFGVSDVAAAVQRLLGAGGRLESPRGEVRDHAIVVDPDGTKVELTRAEADDAGSRTWVVWRQDDNGARFVVSDRHTRDEAERICAELEARGHKQTYWALPG